MVWVGVFTLSAPAAWCGCSAMNIEEIGEPIRTLAVCGGGGMDPLRFSWSGRTYVVDTVNGRWVDRQGENYCLHYSVQVGGETYYIHFSSSQVQWWLDRTITE